MVHLVHLYPFQEHNGNTVEANCANEKKNKHFLFILCQNFFFKIKK